MWILDSELICRALFCPGSLTSPTAVNGVCSLIYLAAYASTRPDISFPYTPACSFKKGLETHEGQLAY